MSMTHKILFFFSKKERANKKINMVKLNEEMNFDLSTK
jgi:hypothetical protein